MGVVHRETLFKLPNREDQQKLLDAYEDLKNTHQKNGKRYMICVSAGRLMPDSRAQGYTIMAQTTFHSLEDMEYYDNQCPAHQALKEVAMQLTTERPLVINLMSADEGWHMN